MPDPGCAVCQSTALQPELAPSPETTLQGDDHRERQRGIVSAGCKGTRDAEGGARASEDQQLREDAGHHPSVTK